jgi:hypothetical protein
MMDIRSGAKYLLKQFPFIYPGNIINSCQNWIDKQHKRKGQYYSQRGPWYKTIFSESFLHHKDPKTLGQPNPKAFYNNKDYPTSSSTLFYLQNSYLFGHKGLILTSRHQVFQEFSHHFGIATLKKFLLKNPFYTFSKNIKKVEGVGAILISPESHNYYHWLNDVLPRIRLYEPVLDKIDHFCIASNVPAKFLAVLADFNIPQEKILLINEKEKLHFDYLYVSSLPGSEGRSPQWAVNYLQDKLIKTTDTAPSKKVYLKRGPGIERRVLNEDAIIKTLQDTGFDIVDPDKLGIQEQINLMQQAKIVVSVHGAALSNLLFVKEGTAVIELFSPDYFRTDCYYTLSGILNLNYYYLQGAKPTGAKWGDIVINEELLTKTITDIA